MAGRRETETKGEGVEDEWTVKRERERKDGEWGKWRIGDQEWVDKSSSRYKKKQCWARSTGFYAIR